MINEPKPCKNGHGIDRLPNGNCHSCEKIKFIKYHSKNKERESTYNREHKRLLRYGITPERYQELFLNQNGKCRICGRSQNNFKRKLSVDHDHKTGQVRGLLCQNCNSLIGLCYEKTEVLFSAIAYLNE